MSEQLVVWEELAQATSNDSSALEIPIFMRDVETLDGEELYPEYGGVSIKRNIRFPIRAPFFDRLAFHLQTARFPIPNSHINFSLLTKNAEVYLGLENVAGVLKSNDDDIYRLTDHRIRAVDGVKCHFGLRYSYAPRWKLLSRYIENIDCIFLEGLQLRKNNKLQFDENRLIVRSNTVSTRLGHARVILPICFSTPTMCNFLEIMGKFCWSSRKFMPF
ncbi:unnamed protein product [Oikopleura dioica]|uniref:Uncharacterized protein n=1 Tax=Oikopleura dioica TaxID=34765 RepID=E4Y3A2_OIKDI|nr:unnamed protein product [Oikopleura dioica]